MIHRIPFTQLPHQTKIFLDYLYHFERTAPFYPSGRTLADAQKLRHQKSPLQCECSRTDVAAILERQNREFGTSAKGLKNIERLKNPDCYAVVTGQQVGLFTGPLYTIYKAMTAVRIAETLTAQGLPAVPIFWMDAEDHDLEEVSRIALLTRDSHVEQFDYVHLIHHEDGAADEPNTARKPVGSIAFPEQIREVVDRFLDTLAKTEFRGEVDATLRASCRPGVTFAQAFAQLLAHIFSQHGLVLFNPLDAQVKRLVAPLYRHAVERAAEFNSILQKRNEALRHAGYHTQIHLAPNATTLFLYEDGERQALITCEDGRFSAKNCEKVLSKEQVLHRLEEHPEHFSGNVVLRPIVQDHLFPTLVYVGGPSEIAYFAQIAPLYAEFHRPMPVIFPRASFTLVEKKIARLFERHPLSFPDVVTGREEWVKRVLAIDVDPESIQRFEAIQNQIQSALNELKEILLKADPTLGDALETARQKMLYHVHHLQTKLVHAMERRHAELTRQAERVAHALSPMKNLQEREINAFYFLSLYGSSLLERIRDGVDVENPDHKLIFL